MQENPINKGGQRNQKDPDGMLAAIINDIRGGEIFALPGALCQPVFESDHDGRAMRVLMSLIWISAAILKGGTQARIYIALTDIRFAAALEGYRSNTPVRDALQGLVSEQVGFADGVSFHVFEELSIGFHDGVECAEWVFSQEFIDLFVQPERFALIDILELRQMTTGTDLSLYLQLRLAWNKKRREVVLAVEDARRIVNLPSEQGLKRIMERTRRSAARVGERMEAKVDVSGERYRGTRTIGKVLLRISEEQTPRHTG